MTPNPSAGGRNRQDSPPVAISATFTAEPLREILSFWFGRLGVDSPIRFAPYNQVFQQLLDHSGLLAQSRGGVKIVLVRLEDWARFREPSAATLESLEQDVVRLVAGLRSAAEAWGGGLLVAICPSGPAFMRQPGHAEFVSRMAAQVPTGLAGLNGVHFVTAAELDQLYPVSERHDPHGDELGHVPYTPEYFTALGTLLARKVHALRATPYKVVALDCDDTLWRGICGEDGPEGVVIDPPRRALQEFMLAQQNAGMLLCLCSKNNLEDVVETFRVHPEMPLRLEDFVARRVNWSAKSANLVSLAEELSLGLDSFVFVDDNPKECGEVQARLPEVLTLPLPDDADDIPLFLKHVWAFDRLQVTEEDKRRTKMYVQGLERARLEKQAKTLEEFIQSLQLEIRIFELRPEALARAAQLTQRTNQMNFTTRRRGEAEIHSLVASGGAECLTVEVTDRFGSYGLTGLAIFTTGPEALLVDTFLLSCRVLGRGVEHRLLARLGEIAVGRGLARVEVPFVPSQRNQPALVFLQSVGAKFKQRTEVGLRFSFPAEAAAAVTYSLSSAAGKPAPQAPPVPVGAIEPAGYVHIAMRLRSVAQIRQQIRAERNHEAAAAPAAAAPRSALEEQLAAVWADLLHLPAVGIHDNFFDLGGHSLLAVQLLSRVRQAHQVDLPLDVVYSSAFTVAELAKAIEIRQIEQAGSEEYAAILAELQGMSDEEARALLAREMEGAEGDGGR